MELLWAGLTAAIGLITRADPELRAIAGLWPWGKGQVETGRGQKILLMPQRAYVPVGTLRRATTYPEPPESASDRSSGAPGPPIRVGTQPGSTEFDRTPGRRRATANASVVR